MVLVKILSSQLVRPADKTPQEIMYLSDCDQIKPVSHAPVVYFYGSTRKTLPELVQIAKDSLSKALVMFYPLAGRLHCSNQESSRFELHCNSIGALLVEAESDFRIDDFGDFRPEAEIRSLIPSVNFSGTPMEELPLLLVQITKLSCGSVTLGTGMIHVVVDGLSATHFVAEWAKIARGGEESHDHPFLDRTILQQHKLKRTDPETDPEKSVYKYSDFFPLPLLIGRADNLEERNKETVAIMVKLSKTQIQTLKSKTNARQLDNINTTFSRFEAVSAHVWKCLSMARGLKPEQETVMFVTVDFRNRISPPLPNRYFGNAVMAVPVASTVAELTSEPLSTVARKIRAAVNRVTDEYVRSYLNCVHTMPDLSQKRHFHTVGCAQGSYYGNPNLIITSWLRLPLHEANLWGDEVRYMGPGSLGYDGRVFLLSDPDQEGSFLLPMRVQAEHATAFQKYLREDI